MKHKVLIVIESLIAAGSEKSLLSFLTVIDYTRYSVDLQLFKYGGEFEQYLPQEVKLLQPLSYSNFVDKSIVRQLFSLDIKKIISRFKYSLSLRLYKNLCHADRARLYWKNISNCIPSANKQYDVAIAYAQGIPTFYVVDKVFAAKKISWVNVSYALSDKNIKYQARFYDAVNYIVTVSNSANSFFQQQYPQFAKKMTIIYDMLVADFIFKLSNEKKEFVTDNKIFNILTVARLNKPQKGYDIALQACKILRDRGIKFKWYALGRGPYKEEMEKYIEENNLQDIFILLGVTPNPYPYIKDATLYVQTSRHEGFGLSIAEARILNTPVVTTEFDAVYNQMVPEKNGLVVKQDPFAVADAIELLLTDKSLYDSIVEYQKHEKKGNTEEIEKFYKLIE